MIEVTEKDSNTALIKLDGELTIYVADKFHLALVDLLNKYQRIDVDMSSVNELDTSCYQVLLRARLLSLKNNKDFNIGSLSDESQQIFDLYNMESVFNHVDQNRH